MRRKEKDFKKKKDVKEKGAFYVDQTSYVAYAWEAECGCVGSAKKGGAR